MTANHLTQRKAEEELAEEKSTEEIYQETYAFIQQLFQKLWDETVQQLKEEKAFFQALLNLSPVSYFWSHMKETEISAINHQFRIKKINLQLYSSNNWTYIFDTTLVNTETRELIAGMHFKNNQTDLAEAISNLQRKQSPDKTVSLAGFFKRLRANTDLLPSVRTKTKKQLIETIS